MKTRLLLFLGAIIFQHYVFAQSKPNNLFDHLSIGFQAGQNSTYHYSALYDGVFCWECRSIKQTWTKSYLWDVSIAYRFNAKHSIEWRYGISTFGYHDFIRSQGGRVYEKERLWKLRGSELLYQWTFWQYNKLKTFIKSGIRIEKVTQGVDIDDFFKAHPVLTFRPGAFVKVTKRVSVHLNGLFKTGVRRFNKWDGSSSYIPYGIGGEVGVSFNFR